MKSKHSRLALLGVLALSISVTAGLISGSLAEAKKKTTKSKSAVVSKTVNAAIPDKAPGSSGPFGRLEVSLNVGKKFKGKVVGPAGPTVTFQTTGNSDNSADDLTVYLAAPKGPITLLSSDIGSPFNGRSIGPLTLTSRSTVGICASATPPCTNPQATLNRPFAGTASDSNLAIYNGTQVKGTWRMIFLDGTGTKTSIVNSVKLSIPTA
jgi:hypothetical protein